MPVRISLILAILCGLGVILLSHFQLRPHIQSIIDQREQNARDRDSEKGQKEKAKKELAATSAELRDTKSKLETTTTQLTDVSKKYDDESKRAADLQKRLTTSEGQRKEAQQELAKWQALGVVPEQVTTLIVERGRLTNEVIALTGERDIWFRKHEQVKNQLEILLGRDSDPPLPETLRGKVLVVDPKWNFVVLDVGEAAGAKERGVLLVSRNSKLVAKVRITSVQGNRSVANIIPGWKLGEILEGDVVMPLIAKL
jgi:hypothetical protein